MREVAIATLRIQIYNPACDRFFNSLSSSLRISKIAAWHSRHATRIAVIVSTVPATVAPSAITRSTIAIPIVTTIVTRMWISLIVRQRIPANVVAEREVERH